MEKFKLRIFFLKHNRCCGCERNFDNLQEFDAGMRIVDIMNKKKT